MHPHPTAAIPATAIAGGPGAIAISDLRRRNMVGSLQSSVRVVSDRYDIPVLKANL
jgi:hypothetical protein